MAMERGIKLALSPARKMAIDMLHFAQQIPSIPVARAMSLPDVAEAREEAAARPSWTSIFMRAYGLVAQRHPELRRMLISFPTPHLYEHPCSIGALVVERDWQDETVLLAAKLRSPETTSLAELQSHIRRFKNEPVLKISEFRQTLRIGTYPRFLRRFLLWHTLVLSGAKRAKRFGTFLVSSYGVLGAEQLHPRSIFTTVLTFGPVAATGAVTVKIVYDHRVLDGATVARALNSLEDVLHTQILDELARDRAAAA